MRIAISGASGFVGTHLTAYLKSQGFGVERLGRDCFAAGAHERLMSALIGCDAVINLAGASIDRRWSRSYKEQLLASRIDTTRKIAAAIDHSPRTRTFISTSAVGCYPNVGCYDEYSAERGSGFLADLCAEWEAAAYTTSARCVITRFGVVLGTDGGAFLAASRPAKAGIALIAGGGFQPFSWIGISDLVRAEEFLLTHTSLSGAFNLTTPERLTQREFVESLAAHYGSRLTVRIPSFAIRLARGKAADFLLRGQCAMPLRLLCAGFQFQTPDIDSFLKSL